MTEALASARVVARADSKFFYFHMALVGMAVAFVGFVPTYWAPMMQGSLKADPVVHIHGIVFILPGSSISSSRPGWPLPDKSRGTA